jgi:hypothetical protein
MTLTLDDRMHPNCGPLTPSIAFLQYKELELEPGTLRWPQVCNSPSRREVSAAREHEDSIATHESEGAGRWKSVESQPM